MFIMAITFSTGPSSQWKFFRRFFIVDNISARSPCHSPSSTAKIVRYAKDLTIRYRLRNCKGIGFSTWKQVLTGVSFADD